jgi:F-type H+-transporting ATPase subunit b
VLLNVFLFKPIMKIVDQRNSSMRSLQDEAAKFSTGAGERLAAYDAKVAEMKKSTAAIMQASRQQAAAGQDVVLKDARAKYTAAIDEATAKIDGQIAQAKAGLKQEADKLSRTMASRILGRDL